MIAFKGINGVFEEDAMKKWCDSNEYQLLTFQFFDVEDVAEFVRRQPIRHVEILGYSRGAPAAYELARKTPLQFYPRLITVGAHKTITASFGTTRKALRNVKQHLNFSETHQQPPDFDANPINISLGVCSHFEAVSEVLKQISQL